MRYTGLMAEFVAEKCGVSSPSAGGKSAQPGDDADGKAASEVSVSNGDCGLCAPEDQGLETTNASVVLDGKTGIPRKASIIKVKTINASAFFSFVGSFGVKPRPHTRLHPQVWRAYVMDVQKSQPTVNMSLLFPPDQIMCSFQAYCDFMMYISQDEVTCAPLHLFLSFQLTSICVFKMTS